MAIPYRTAKFKSANTLAIAILGSTAKFNARQYFRLYGMSSTSSTNPLTSCGATKVSNTQEVYSQDHHQHPMAPHTVNAGAVIPTEAG